MKKSPSVSPAKRPSDIKAKSPDLKDKEAKGKEAKGKEAKGKEAKGKEDKEAKGKEDKEAKGKQAKGKEDKGKEDKDKEVKGKEAKGKEDKGKEAKGKEDSVDSVERSASKSPRNVVKGPATPKRGFVSELTETFRRLAGTQARPLYTIRLNDAAFLKKLLRAHDSIASGGSQRRCHPAAYATVISRQFTSIRQRDDAGSVLFFDTVYPVCSEYDPTDVPSDIRVPCGPSTNEEEAPNKETDTEPKASESLVASASASSKAKGGDAVALSEAVAILTESVFYIMPVYDELIHSEPLYAISLEEIEAIIAGYDGLDTSPPAALPQATKVTIPIAVNTMVGLVRRSAHMPDAGSATARDIPSGAKGDHKKVLLDAVSTLNDQVRVPHVHYPEAADEMTVLPGGDVGMMFQRDAAARHCVSLIHSQSALQRLSISTASRNVYATLDGKVELSSLHLAGIATRSTISGIPDATGSTSQECGVISEKAHSETQSKRHSTSLGVTGFRDSKQVPIVTTGKASIFLECLRTTPYSLAEGTRWKQVLLSQEDLSDVEDSDEELPADPNASSSALAGREVGAVDPTDEDEGAAGTNIPGLDALVALEGTQRTAICDAEVAERVEIHVAGKFEWELLKPTFVSAFKRASEGRTTNAYINRNLTNAVFELERRADLLQRANQQATRHAQEVEDKAVRGAAARRSHAESLRERYSGHIAATPGITGAESDVALCSAIIDTFRKNSTLDPMRDSGISHVGHTFGTHAAPSPLLQRPELLLKGPGGELPHKHNLEDITEHSSIAALRDEVTARAVEIARSSKEGSSTRSWLGQQSFSSNAAHGRCHNLEANTIRVLESHRKKIRDFVTTTIDRDGMVARFDSSSLLNDASDAHSPGFPSLPPTSLPFVSDLSSGKNHGSSAKCTVGGDSMSSSQQLAAWLRSPEPSLADTIARLHNLPNFPPNDPERRYTRNTAPPGASPNSLQLNSRGSTVERSGQPPRVPTVTPVPKRLLGDLRAYSPEPYLSAMLAEGDQADVNPDSPAHSEASFQKDCLGSFSTHASDFGVPASQRSASPCLSHSMSP